MPSRIHLFVFLVVLVVYHHDAVSVVRSFSQNTTPNKKVIVTGAGGRTGELVFSSLYRNENFDVVGLVRTEKSAKKLIQKVKCGLENIWICDVTKLDPNGENGIPNGYGSGLSQKQGHGNNSSNGNGDNAASSASDNAGANGNTIGDNNTPSAATTTTSTTSSNAVEAMIICTSAVPKICKRSLVKAFLKIPWNIVTGKKKILNVQGIRFRYRDGQYPEKVDYEGQIAQIELAKKLGISHVILLSSMGGTNKYDFLNTIGKDKNGNGNGDILIYKRKAEQYLINSGLHYTIIHPGGLKDTPGGVMDLKLDVNDNLLKEEKRSISRCDVARLCIASLTAFNGQNASFDCINCDVQEEGGESKPKSAEQAIQKFLEEGKVYDYSL